MLTYAHIWEPKFPKPKQKITSKKADKKADDQEKKTSSKSVKDKVQAEKLTTA